MKGCYPIILIYISYNTRTHTGWSMPTLDIRITRILYVHITSSFDLTVHVSGAITPLHNTYSKRVFSTVRIDEQLFSQKIFVLIQKIFHQYNKLNIFYNQLCSNDMAPTFEFMNDEVWPDAILVGFCGHLVSPDHCAERAEGRILSVLRAHLQVSRRFLTHPIHKCRNVKQGLNNNQYNIMETIYSIAIIRQ